MKTQTIRLLWLIYTHLHSHMPHRTCRSINLEFYSQFQIPCSRISVMQSTTNIHNYNFMFCIWSLSYKHSCNKDCIFSAVFHAVLLMWTLLCLILPHLSISALETVNSGLFDLRRMCEIDNTDLVIFVLLYLNKWKTKAFCK